MITPFIVEDLFELNPNSSVSYYPEYVCIDDFYKNFTDIQAIFANMTVESWKMSQWTRNFKDYFDCRPMFSNSFPDTKKSNARLHPIKSLVSSMLHNENVTIEQSLSFNVFKHNKKDVPAHKQHHPHYDDNKINVLIYLDNFCEGSGTNLYENIDVTNTEEVNLIVDISKYKLLETIPAKPNRCVIFNGNQLHGAYIKDNNIYYDNWKITQASILQRSDT